MASSDFKDIASRTVTGAAAGNVTVTGIKKNDIIITVVPVSAAGANQASEFTATADDTINNTGGTSTATKTMLVQWIAGSGSGREKLAAGTAARSRTSY